MAISLRSDPTSAFFPFARDYLSRSPPTPEFPLCFCSCAFVCVCAGVCVCVCVCVCFPAAAGHPLDVVCAPFLWRLFFFALVYRPSPLSHFLRGKPAISFEQMTRPAYLRLFFFSVRDSSREIATCGNFLCQALRHSAEWEPQVLLFVLRESRRPGRAGNRRTIARVVQFRQNIILHKRVVHSYFPVTDIYCFVLKLFFFALLPRWMNLRWQFPTCRFDAILRHCGCIVHTTEIL